MTYLLKRTNIGPKYGGFKRIFLSLFLVLVCIGLVKYWSGLGDFLSTSLSPFFNIGSGIYIGEDAVSQAKYNLEVESADYNALKSENEILREALRLRPSEEAISAPVIARPPQVPLDTLLLGAGEDDGLKEGDMVLAGDRVLVGQIVKISRNTATVKLNSFAGNISYGFSERTLEPIEMQGVGGGSMEVRVPIDFDILVSDKIMTEGGKAYLIAGVAGVEEDRSLGFKKVLMALPVNISKSNIVFIESALNQ